MPVSPPALPDGADQIKPVTIHATFQGERRQILRTFDRVLVVTSDREWLFERNTVDPRRVSATIVEHDHKSIVLYGESDVRNLLGLNGWADVIASTSENALAGQKATTIESVRTDVDSHLLRPCQTRFPSYRLLDVADWLESRH
jgi:hypothetical protein